MYIINYIMNYLLIIFWNCGSPYHWIILDIPLGQQNQTRIKKITHTGRHACLAPWFTQGIQRMSLAPLVTQCQPWESL